MQSWFAARGWTPFDYQLKAWEAYRSGRSGLIHAPTGTGKTLAAWLGPLSEALDKQSDPAAPGRMLRKPRRTAAEPLRVLWVTPMRALATDTAAALEEPLHGLGLNWTVEKRTGDTSSHLKLKQKERLPTALVTTPESLGVLLSQPGAEPRFASLRCVVVDEWHELLSTKRGVQTELCLARLRSLAPGLRTWGVSATLGNLQQALEVLCGCHGTASSPYRVGAPDAAGHAGTRTPAPVLIHAHLPKEIRLSTLVPEDCERFPWAGHLGLRTAGRVAELIDGAASTLLFTNTRSQAELWFKELLHLRPDWLGKLALHHGSLDRRLRGRVEGVLKSGAMKCVVCTSSLDLGVDFSPVDQVIQVGSPKGVARLLQRAGRSGHAPGSVSRVVCVPAHAFELVEFAAARGAVEARDVEPREPITGALDVLAQHLVTLACAGPFDESAVLAEVRSTHAFASLTATQWGWVLDFVLRGGAALNAYPRFARLRRNEQGMLEVASPQTARQHRLNIGTIASDNNLIVKVRGGSNLGTIEESFVARLAAGDKFVFAGHVLELVSVREMSVSVRRTTNRSGIVPRWSGGQMSLSSRLAARVRAMVAAAAAPGPDAPPSALQSAEMIGARPLLDLQARWSHLPREDELLIESISTREGHHVYVYPFEGRAVHEGLGAILARRLARLEPRSILVAMNDYGLELSSPTPFDLNETSWRELLSAEGLLDDMLASVNTSEMTRRRFRDIARVAGLIQAGPPMGGAGAGSRAPSSRHVQASANLFFDVFAEFDPANLLLEQAKNEVLSEQLQITRLASALRRIASMKLVLKQSSNLTPLAFPIWAESLRTQQVSSERWADRVKRMVVTLESRASEPSPRRRGGRRGG